MDKVRLSQYSHGAGCGCKISPAVLETMLQSSLVLPDFPQLLVGNQSKDDAAVFDIGNGQAVISTTDFFMPIVDDANDFGQIAACNAISDVYAMGGKPIMAIAILGWPINQLSADVAQQVLDGARTTCLAAGIPLAGGHSIDAPEPIFGLAVTGLIATDKIKQNNQAQVGDLLYLTKPLGIGILTTAEKQQKLLAEHAQLAPDTMKTLNSAGMVFAELEDVHAMTDVTGFALLGHLLEMCQGSELAARLQFDAIPKFEAVNYYIEQGCIPGGCQRNFDSYGQHISALTNFQKAILCDPQTSGGLLLAVAPSAQTQFEQYALQQGLALQPIGELIAVNKQSNSAVIEVLA